MIAAAQILNIAGVSFDFLVVLIITRRVFLRKEKAKDEMTKEIGQSFLDRFLSEKSQQEWVLPLLCAGFVCQIIGILLD